MAIKQLREQLAAALNEKEQLQRDVAMLCEARSDRMFSSGYLLSEQASSLKQDNCLVRQQLRAVTAERDSLLEDINHWRESKHQSDKGWRDAQQRALELETELQFYQASNARAITDRDTAAFESSQLKQQLAASEQRAADLQSQLGAERQQGAALRRQELAARQEGRAASEKLRESAGEVQALQDEGARAAEAQRRELEACREELSSLQADLKAAQDAERRAAEAGDAALEARRAAEERATRLELTVAELTQQLAWTREQAARSRAQASALQKQLNERSAREGELETNIQQLTAALVAAQAGVKELQQQQAAAWRSQDMDDGRGADSLGQSPVEQPGSPSSADAAPSSRRHAQQLLSLQRELEERDAVLSALQLHCNQLKERLAAAVREKVEALLRAADASASASGAEAQAAGPQGATGVAAAVAAAAALPVGSPGGARRGGAATTGGGGARRDAGPGGGFSGGAGGLTVSAADQRARQHAKAKEAAAAAGQSLLMRSLSLR